MVAVNPAAIMAAARRRRKGSSTRDPNAVRPQSRREVHYGKIAARLRQAEVRAAYMNPTVQWCIAGLIMGNFLTNIVEKQIDPWNQNYPSEWKVIEAVWNIVFIIELGWNMYGCWYCTTLKGHFLCSGWNLFDFLVVAVSVPSLTGADLGSFSQMRMLRAFRVFRLFKRIKSLNKIIVALGNAVPGIVNAAIVQTLVMCIYAILAVDLFGDFGTQGHYTNIEFQNISTITMRGMTYGEEYYGNFFRSLYTLFQVLTGESWSEAVARPVIFADGAMPYIGGVYYVSYILICGIVLVNVAVAVLLEKMVDVGGEETVDGIKLTDLPATAQTILAPLDTDNDGVITKDELTKAAMLLRRDAERSMGRGSGDDEGGDEESMHQRNSVAADEISRVLAENNRAETSSAVRDMQDQMAAMRQEAAERDRKLTEALMLSQQREARLDDTLSSLATRLDSLSAAAAQRAKRKPGNGRRASTEADGGAAGAVAADGGGTEEDRVQDGMRSASKGGPDRLQRL